MRTKVLVAALSSALLVLGVVSAAGASLSPGTKLTGTSSKVVLVGSINGVQITVTCGGQGSLSFTDSGTVEKGDETSMPVGDPSITGCFDSLGGHDIITTSGKWKLTVNGAGTKLTFVIPKDGMTLTSSILSTCKVIAAPKEPVDLSGNYSRSAATDTVKSAKIAVKGSGCTAKSPMLATLTVTFSPNPGKIPPFAS